MHSLEKSDKKKGLENNKILSEMVDRGKDLSMILDATAGNRTMWAHKNSDNIIYIDVEKKLEVPPTIFASCESTPFPDNFFDAIFYDPPHNWGGGVHYFSFPSKHERKEVFPNAGGIPTYYGWDKYKSRHALIRHIYNAQQEFRRVLKPDGLLFFKWNEMRVDIYRILSIFHDWYELMRLYIQDPSHTAGEHQTYWIILTQKHERIAQQSLEQWG